MDEPLLNSNTRDRARMYDSPARGSQGSVNDDFNGCDAVSPDYEIGVRAKGNLQNMGSTVHLVHREIEHPTSNCETTMHVLKGNIGTGVLAMPDAFKNSGLAVGTVGVVLIGVICVHCMQVLVRCADILTRRTGIVSLDYNDVVELSFKTGPLWCRPHAKFARTLTSSVLCIVQLGFCCVYLTFVSTNLKQLVDCNTPDFVEYSVQAYMAALLIPLTLMNFIRNLKYLAPLSTLSNILQTVSLVIMFYYLLTDLPSITDRKQFATWSQLPLWFGTAIYAFEGISLVLPLENNMKTPAAFRGCLGVLNVSMMLVATTYTAVGFFGYLKYGESVLGSITLNLPSDRLAQSVKLMYSAAIFLTYCIQFYVPVRIMWPNIQRKITRVDLHYPLELCFRAALIFLTFILAAGVPKLGLFISLVGAFAGSYLAVIMPPLLETLVLKGEDKLTWPYAVKNTLITGFGLLGFATGTYVSVKQIVEEMSGGHIDELGTNSTMNC